MSSMRAAEKALTARYGVPARLDKRLLWKLDGGVISLNPPQPAKGKRRGQYAPFVIYSTEMETGSDGEY